MAYEVVQLRSPENATLYSKADAHFGVHRETPNIVASCNYNFISTFIAHAIIQLRFLLIRHVKPRIIYLNTEILTISQGQPETQSKSS